MNKESIKNKKSLVDFIKEFNEIFENEVIDSIVNQEFPKKYALLPLLVKAQLYYNEQ